MMAAASRSCGQDSMKVKFETVKEMVDIIEIFIYMTEQG